MKTKLTIKSSANARLRQARLQALEIESLLAGSKDITAISALDMGKLRDAATDVVQCIHEARAYWNTLETT